MRARPMPAWAGGRSRRHFPPRRFLGLALVLSAAFLAWYLDGAEADLAPGTPIGGVVERVVDGDTLVIAGQRLRLAGLDAPEHDQTCARDDGAEWACGTTATAELRRLVRGQTLACEQRQTDKYHRPLVTCSTSPNGDLGARLVATGYAVAYGAYRAEEASAREARLGVWQGRFEAPEDWRRDKGRAEAGGNPSRFERFLAWLSQWLGS